MRRPASALLVASALIALGSGAVLGVSALPHPKDAPSAAPAAATAAVQRRTLNATTQVGGTLGYADTYTIASGLATTADATAAVQSYASALAQYDAAVNALTALRNPKAAEVAGVRAQIAQAEATLLVAEQAAAGPSSKDVNQAKSQLASAQVQLQKAQEAAKGPTAAEIAQARAQVATAQAQLLTAQSAAAGATAAQVAVADAAATQAAAQLTSDRAALARAQAALAACQVASPPPSCDVAALGLAVQQADGAVAMGQAQLLAAQEKRAALTSTQAQAQAQANLASAQAAVSSAQAALAALTAGVNTATGPGLVAAASAAAAAQSALDALLNGNPAQTAAQLKTARAQLAAAQAALDAIQHPSATQQRSAEDAVSTASLQLDVARRRMDQPSGVLTQIAEAGAIVQPGGVLFTLDGTYAVVLMTGVVPAWRRLDAGVPDGVDVRQLEANLVALGFGTSALTVDDHWDDETTAAVKRWQSSLGVADTGAVALGAVVFEPGAMRIAARSATLGATVQAGAPVLQATSTRRVVTVALATSLQSKVKKGDAVAVTLPDGKSASGTVSYVSNVAAAAAGAAASTSPTITVLATLDDPSATGTLDQAPVTVNITTATAKDVLAVPVGALVQLLDRGYAVQIKDGDGLHYLSVKLGLFAAGWVQVSGEGLAEGQTVVVAQ